MERPFFFEHDSLSLFGVFHEGEGPERKTPFVLCHPFGEEKLWTHRVFVSFARELARRGHAVLRFDLTANGDSEGDFRSVSVTTALNDLAFAIDTLKDLTATSDVGLLGLRFGATLAALIAESRTDVRTLVLWAPIVQGERYAQELLRINLATQMAAFREIRRDRAALVDSMRRGGTVNVDGYPMGHDLYQQMTSISLTSEPKTFGGATLIVHVDPAEVPRQPDELRRLAAQYRSALVEVVQEDPFWKEIRRFYETAPNLFRTTLTWLEAR